MGFLFFLVEVLRDLAVLAAAVGVAKWTWDQHTDVATRRQQAASAAIEAERLRVDLRNAAARIETLVREATAARSASDPRAQAVEARWALKLALHRLLQASTEPFLTFAELQQGLAAANAGAPPSADDLRRAILEMIADGAIAQMDRDRYFIASDFEDDDVHSLGN